MANDTTITNKSLEELFAEAEQYAADYGKAIQDNDLAAKTEAEKSLKDVESQYAAKAENILFVQCRDSQNPILEGVRALQYNILSHRILKDNGEEKGVEIHTDRVKRVDLARLGDFCKLPVSWKYKVENAGALLAYRAAKELGLKPAEMAKLKKEYWMSDIAQKEKLGETPTSNNQVCKLLQQVVDAIMFEDDGNGKNKYKVVARHVAYMLDCYTRGGAKPLEVKVSKANYIAGLFTDILHTIVTDADFKLTGYKVRREGDAKADRKVSTSAEVSTPEPAEVSAPAEVSTSETLEEMPSMDEIPADGEAAA